MSKSLVIVESPAKVKTINKILGDKYKVVSSMGHLIDLPKSTLGVDCAHDFKPTFVILRNKQKVLNQIKKEAKTKKEIYIATDPDREGEAIGWNLVGHLGEGKKVMRVTFQEITKDAVLKAFKHPRVFDAKKVDAQLARRILDRIVGYKISPLLWKNVGSRLSAGRVQSVALRLIVERDKEIKAFIPQEYWQIAVDLEKQGVSDILTAYLEKINNEKVEIKTQDHAAKLSEEIKKENFVVSGVTLKDSKRNPLPPYITSTMQQDAFNKLGFNATKTMMLSQQLYEGIEVGGDESVGLITYMRTDSVAVSSEAVDNVRRFIEQKYSKKYLPEKPNVYRSKKSAQEAHEAIRPTGVERRPEDMKKYLDSDQAKLYELIWRRFVASQMVPALYQNRKLEIATGPFLFGATGTTLIFDGYLAAMPDNSDEEAKTDLAKFGKGDALKLIEVKPSQHFTKPPARYSEASLIKALEEDGIGRPSTYAAIIYTLVMRNYVFRDRGYFNATDLGEQICKLLIEYFPKIMDVGFTAQMEEHLDQVEDGDLNYVNLLHEFYKPFREELDFATSNMKTTQNFVDQNCPQCGRQMVTKWGRRGQFLSCSGFPQCKYAQAILSGVKCPEKDCAGELVQRRSRGGKMFYGCSKYPNCTYTANRLPPDGKDSSDKTQDISQ